MYAMAGVAEKEGTGGRLTWNYEKAIVNKYHTSFNEHTFDIVSRGPALLIKERRRQGMSVLYYSATTGIYYTYGLVLLRFFVYVDLFSGAVTGRPR